VISCKCVEQANERHRAYRLRAVEYRRFYRNIPAGEWQDELDEAVLPDGRPQSVTLLAEQDGQAVGTGRLTLVRHPRYPGLKADCVWLMDFDLDQLLRVAGFDPERVAVGEVGRFAIARDGDILSAKRCVLARLGDEAEYLGIDVLLAIMPPFIAQSLAESGVHYRRWEPARCRRDTLEVMRVLLRYHDYFLPVLRERGLAIDPEALERTRDLAALQAFASDCPDGPSLWFIRTEEWVRTAKRLTPSFSPAAAGGLPNQGDAI
jgi:hypothetical protein